MTDRGLDADGSVYVPGSHAIGSEHCDKGLCNEGGSWPWRCDCGGLVHHFSFNANQGRSVAAIERCERCGWFRETYY